MKSSDRKKRKGDKTPGGDIGRRAYSREDGERIAWASTEGGAGGQQMHSLSDSVKRMRARRDLEENEIDDDIQDGRGDDSAMHDANVLHAPQVVSSVEKIGTRSAVHPKVSYASVPSPVAHQLDSIHRNLEERVRKLTEKTNRVESAQSSTPTKPASSETSESVMVHAHPEATGSFRSSASGAFASPSSRIEHIKRTDAIMRSRVEEIRRKVQQQ